jgi:magnesium transporter
MIKLYSPKSVRAVTVDELPVDRGQDVLWIDLLDPTLEEIKAVEALEQLSLPTRNEAQEIEISSRLYIESRTLFMTATIMVRATDPSPGTTTVTFVYRPGRLVTLRFDDAAPFKVFGARHERSPETFPTAQKVFLGLFDEIVDRIADILELVAADLNNLSNTIFASESREPGAVNYNDVLRRIGQNAARTTNARESLVSLRRVHGFFTETCGNLGSEQVDEHWRITGKDVIALADHANFVSSKVTFILDATLGLINSEQNSINSQQNKIIKLFSVLAVVLLPPTLIASIYGMNFQHMPELRWPWGYPMALVLMLISAVVPYLIFKYKRWL